MCEESTEYTLKLMKETNRSQHVKRLEVEALGILTDYACPKICGLDTESKEV